MQIRELAVLTNNILCDVSALRRWEIVSVYTERIREFTHAVHDLLTAYFEVHDGLFAQRWWRSIPIPGLYKRMPIERYQTQMGLIEQALGEIVGRVEIIYPK